MRRDYKEIELELEAEEKEMDESNTDLEWMRKDSEDNFANSL